MQRRSANRPSTLQEEIQEVIKLPPTERILERNAEHIVQVPVPQTLEEVAEVVKAVKNAPQEHTSEKTGEQMTGPSESDDFEDCESPADAVHQQVCRSACRDTATGFTVAQPGDHLRRDSAHQQGCRGACCDTATGFTVAQPGDQACRDSADTVHRPDCCRAYYGTATGPSVSNCAEDGGSPAGAVHRQSRVRQSINQATKHAWIPQNMYVDTLFDMLVALHQQVPQVQTVPERSSRPFRPHMNECNS